MTKSLLLTKSLLHVYQMKDIQRFPKLFRLNFGQAGVKLFNFAFMSILYGPSGFASECV